MRSGDGFVQVGAQLWSSPSLTLESVTHLRAAFVAPLELPRVSLLPHTWLLEGICGLAAASTTHPLCVPKDGINPCSLCLHHVPPGGHRATAEHRRQA